MKINIEIIRNNIARKKHNKKNNHNVDVMGIAKAKYTMNKLIPCYGLLSESKLGHGTTKGMPFQDVQPSIY